MNDALKKLVEDAKARGPMTQDEIDAQRRSYILAEAGFGSDADEAEYAAAVRSGDQDAIAKCEADSAERVRQMDEILGANAALKNGSK